MKANLGQFVGGTLSDNWSNVEVCPDRPDSLLGARKIALGSPQSDDPDLPRAGESADSGRSSTTKCVLR